MNTPYEEQSGSTAHSSWGFSTEPPPAWQEQAICAQTDPDAFFPEKGGTTREAKRVCAGCEVKDECLQHALDNDERYGVWGGLSERERRSVKRHAPATTKTAHCKVCDAEMELNKYGPERQYCSQTCRETAAQRRSAAA